jgi:hypothetical protein
MDLGEILWDGTGYGPVEGSLERSNELSDYIKC